MKGRIMQVRRTAIGAWFLVTLFVLQSTFSAVDLSQDSTEDTLHNSDGVEWVQFDLVDGVYGDAVGSLNQTLSLEERQMTAISSIGTFDLDGLHLERPMSTEWLQGRADLRLYLIDSSVHLQTARSEICLLYTSDAADE